MSILFPKVNKPREWDHHPIYYDEQKEARKEKLARLHRGSFREEYEQHKQQRAAKQKARLGFWIALLLIVAVVYWMLR